MVLGKRQKIIPDPKRVSKNLNSMWMTTLSQSRLPRHLFQKVQNSRLVVAQSTRTVPPKPMAEGAQRTVTR